MYDDTTDEVLAEGKVSHTITWHGKKLGFIGLVEKEWIETLSTIDEEDLDYIDFMSEGRRLAQQLRAEGVDYVIALTHMRWRNDIRLAENVKEIDLILGGHDHDVGCREVNGRKVVKSGMDFRNYSIVTLTFTGDSHVDVDVQDFLVDSSIPEDEEVKSIVEEYTKLMGDELDTVLGHIDVDLDGRFKVVRTQESNLGNFITGIMLMSTEADVAILNSGALRSDRMHYRGEFKVRDVKLILPLNNSVVVIAVTGSQLIAALENGVSKYPALEGCFPQVSGISFTFDPKKPPGERVTSGSVVVGHEPVDPNKIYRLCTNDFVANGRDGYDCLAGSRRIVNEEDGPELRTIVQNHFHSVSRLTGACKSKYYHHQSIIPRSERKILLQQTNVAKDEADSRAVDQEVLGAENVQSEGRSLWRKARIALAFARHRTIEEAEAKEVKVALAPTLEHRIKNLSDAAAYE